jgi:hypothetical protein
VTLKMFKSLLRSPGEVPNTGFLYTEGILLYSIQAIFVECQRSILWVGHFSPTWTSEMSVEDVFIRKKTSPCYNYSKVNPQEVVSCFFTYSLLQ